MVGRFGSVVRARTIGFMTKLTNGKQQVSLLKRAGAMSPAEREWYARQAIHSGSDSPSVVAARRLRSVG